MITLRCKHTIEQAVPVALPGSKSMAARALVINSLAPVPALLSGIPHCEDTDVLRRALEIISEGHTDVINVAGAGTAMRFLTALIAATPGAHFTLTGSERMQKRPIDPIVDALRQLGADIRYLGREGFPPLLIEGRALSGSEVSIRSDISSQFVSALMMVAPLLPDGLLIHRHGAKTVSRPYISMTADIMRRFGASVDFEGTDIRIGGAPYSAPEDFIIEPDWSAASYFYELGALSSNPVVIRNLIPHNDSCQGDSRCESLFANLGVSTEYLPDGGAVLRGGGPTSITDADLSETPDLVPALAVAHCLCGVPFHFKGINHLRLKESDRLAVIVAELAKLGFVASHTTDTLSWDGETSAADTDNPIRTHDDHRIAMAFAPAVLRFHEITILHEGVVDKSYPMFWNNLENLGIKIYF